MTLLLTPLCALLLAAAPKPTRGGVMTLVRGLSIMAGIAAVEWLWPDSGAKLLPSLFLSPVGLFMPVFGGCTAADCTNSAVGACQSSSPCSFEVTISGIGGTTCLGVSCSSRDGTFLADSYAANACRWQTSTNGTFCGANGVPSVTIRNSGAAVLGGNREIDIQTEGGAGLPFGLLQTGDYGTSCLGFSNLSIPFFSNSSLTCDYSSATCSITSA